VHQSERLPDPDPPDGGQTVPGCQLLHLLLIDTTTSRSDVRRASIGRYALVLSLSVLGEGLEQE